LRFAYICDDCVTIVGSHEVLDSTGRSIFKLVTTDEVICQLVLCCVGGCAVHDGYGAICLDAVPNGIVNFGHCAGITARCRRAGVVLSPEVY
jgi:hypothetical protein